MKTTRDTLLVVFVSFIWIVELARCGAAANVLEDRNKETEELEELVRKEVFTSLQLLGDEEDDIERSSYTRPNRNGNRDSNGYYQLSNQTPNNNLQASGNSYKIPEYSSSSSYYSGSSKPFNENGVRYDKSSGNSNSPIDYRYKTSNQEIRSNGNSKTGRSSEPSPSPTVSAMNTREPDDYTITLPSLGGGRLYYGGGGYNGGAGYGGGGSYNGIGGAALRLPGGLIRRGIRRLGRLGGGSGSGNGFRYGLGGGGLTGMLGGAGLQGMNLGFAGSRGGGGGSGGGYYADYSGDGGNLSSGGGRQGSYGNGRYGLQGNYDGSGSGGSWTIGGGGDVVAPTDYYNLRYGYPGTSNTVSASADGSTGGGGGGGSRRYTLSYPNDSTSTSVSTADEENPTQYELMFLRNQSDSPNRRIQTGPNQDSDLQITTSGSASGTNRDTPNGAGYRINLSGGGSGASSTASAPGGGVEEYRVVVVNKDSPGNGSGRNGISLSTSGSTPGASGSGSWSVSSSGTSGSGSSGGRIGQGGFQITTPITSTQVSVPPSSIVGSVLSTVQGAVSGDQTRSLSTSNDSSAGKIIQLIPVKSSN